MTNNELLPAAAHGHAPCDGDWRRTHKTVTLGGLRRQDSAEWKIGQSYEFEGTECNLQFRGIVSKLDYARGEVTLVRVEERSKPN